MIFLSKRPLVPVVIFYICGLIFAKYFYIPQWIYFLAVPAGLTVFSKNNRFKMPVFYLCVFIIGCLFYNLPIQRDMSSGCGALKEYIRGIIYYNVPAGEERSLLAGLFLGERQKVSEELVNIMRNTNTIHILAISGDHIGFIGLMFIGILRLLFVPRKIALFTALIGVLIYVSMIGWQAPTFRAAVMFGVFAIGWILDRQVDNINTLAFAALVILLVTPQSLFEAGFQLSFVIVLSLIIGVPNIQGNYITKIFLGSSIAWIGCLPLVAYYFQIISPISIIANLVMVTGISIVLAIGFTSIFFGTIYIGLSGIFNAVNYFITKGLIAFLKLVSEIPFGYFQIEKFPTYIVFLAYLIIFPVLLSLSRKSSSVVK